MDTAIEPRKPPAVTRIRFGLFVRIAAFFGSILMRVGSWCTSRAGFPGTLEDLVREAIFQSFESISDAVIIADTTGRIAAINRGAEDMLELDKFLVQGSNLFHLCSHHAADQSRIAQLLMQYRTVRNFSTELRGANGKVTPVLLSIDFIKNAATGREFAIVSVIKDNSEVIRMLQTDALTGVYNRGYFNRKVLEEYERLRRSHMDRLTVVFVDLDGFGKINKDHGHATGDEVLQRVGRVLGKGLRIIDTVARYGGEEFVLILPNTDKEGALQVAERIRTEIAQIRVRPSKDVEFGVTASIGIQTHEGPEGKAEQLVSQADRAMRFAKLGGKNQTVLFSPVIERPFN